MASSLTTRPATRWTPFEDVFAQFNRLAQDSTWRPSGDVIESDKDYVVQLEVPGVQREDISIDLTGTTLAVTGELKAAEQTGEVRHSTRRTGKFAYRLRLPRNFNADNVEAKLADGVLTVRVPKAEVAQPRRIEITA